MNMEGSWQLLIRLVEIRLSLLGKPLPHALKCNYNKSAAATELAPPRGEEDQEHGCLRQGSYECRTGSK